jgi:hypothetical protein
VRHSISMRLFLLCWAVFGARTTVLCQVVAEFHTEHSGVHYTTRLTLDQLASGPEWRREDPNPPLAARRAMAVASIHLKQLFDNAHEWKLTAVTLEPVRDRWLYVVSFEAPPPAGCMDCLALPFTMVVTMDGHAVPAETSPARVQPAVVNEQ